ncbi:hypothetical protein [Sphingomonas mollis]|uniref:Uncharacterized protein n=1 Tax=Sphingomonas mollis TaxID=2795726 RepID=A0ABS0XU11_9SPHN|nr:hypothetical protein [Sphingomonas sp. BT553]MBJ6123534.1 hypothetical protein [Sphingomonas sp. BT553]
MSDKRIFHLNRAEQEIERARRANLGAMRQLHLTLARLHVDAATGFGPHGNHGMQI